MKIVYCMEWSLFKKQPHNILSEQDAKERYKKEQSYVSVIYENKKVKHVIESDKMSISVRFYNDDLENYLLYGFVKKEGKLFLNMAYYYTYKESKKVEHILFNFEENGEMFIEKRDFITGNVEEKDGVVDVSFNWEYYPNFGDYSGLIRVERENA